MLTPQRTRAGVAKLQAAVIVGTLAFLFVPVIISRVRELDERAVKVGLYAAAGVVIAIVLMRFFIATDERL
ncbi:MAG TPA: hypothetical protein VI391_09555 [Thermoanaerobaculia bacterium]